MKAELFSLDNKDDLQRRREMELSPAERWNLAFQLIELARAISPNKLLEPPKDDWIAWIELKPKDDTNKRGS